MAQVIANPKISVEITFTIDESEARALNALANYGDDEFIAAFYEFLGQAYLKNHEAGLRKFLTSIRNTVNPGLHQLEQARMFLDKKIKLEDIEC